MEVRELARLVVLLIALLDKHLEEKAGDDAGTKSMKKEVRALTQVYSERVRLEVTEPYHTTTRGQAALARAEEK